MSLSTHFIGYIMTGSFKGRENQYIPVVEDSALYTTEHRQATTDFPTEGWVWGSKCQPRRREASMLTTSPLSPLAATLNQTQKENNFYRSCVKFF